MQASNSAASQGRLRSALVAAAIAFLGCPSHSPAGQPFTTQNGSLVDLRFGAAVSSVETLVEYQATVSWRHEPVGIRKEIELKGLSLVFIRDQLSTIHFTRDYDFAAAMTPFEDRFLNPPSLGSEKGLGIDQLTATFDEWSSKLTKTGYSRATNDKAFGPRQFFTERLTSGLRLILKVGPCTGGVFHGCRGRADWVFIFTDDGRLQEVNAEAGELSADFIPKRK